MSRLPSLTALLEILREQGRYPWLWDGTLAQRAGVTPPVSHGCFCIARKSPPVNPAHTRFRHESPRREPETAAELLACVWFRVNDHFLMF